MNKIKNFSVLIPDAENPAFIKYVIYALSHHKNIKIHLLSQKPWFPMRFSSYVTSCTITHTTQYNDEWMEAIYDLTQKKKIDAILPMGILARALLSKYKDHPIDEHMLLPDAFMFDIANNKGKLAEYLNKKELPHPITVFKKRYERLSFDEISKLKFPILIKPTDGRGGKGIQLFSSQQELMDKVKNIDLSSEYVIQQYIEHSISYGCGVLCKDGKIQAYTSYKFEQRYDNPFSFSPELLFIDNQEIFTITKKLMSSLNWSGVANIDFLYDKKNSEYKILEINPRHWSTLSMSVEAGVNFPYLEVLSILSLSIPKSEYKLQRYYMVKYAFKMFLKSFRSAKIDFTYLKKTNTFDMLKDPLPILFEQTYSLYLKFKRE